MKKSPEGKNWTIGVNIPQEANGSWYSQAGFGATNR